MAIDASVEFRRQLRRRIEESDLLCKPAPVPYEPGDRLAFELTGVCPATRAEATFTVDKFVGGGFAGQVYRVRLDAIAGLDDTPLPGAESPIPQLSPGRLYAIKIIVPSSKFSLLFRDAIYWAAYQGDFSAQVNPHAARTGVLWQKLIRRAAAIRFDREDAVVDTYATFFDPAIRSYGEVNEWVEGRTWLYEVDDRLFERRRWESGPVARSPEYVAKRRFMRDIVGLLHEMGAPELARQYEWATCKSQPNVLKRLGAGPGPADGLTAIDWRAGLALLPFLPMSPGDAKLIWQGLGRGDLVQFDRGDLGRLERFCESHGEAFEDLRPVLDELREQEEGYRQSLLDATHHSSQALQSPSLRKNIRDGYVQGWRVKLGLDGDFAEKLRACPARFALFFALGLLPILGTLSRRGWGSRRFAAHMKKLATDLGYLMRYFRQRRTETMIRWSRVGAVSQRRALRLIENPLLFWLQVAPLFWAPPKWRRFLSDPAYARDTLKNSATYLIHFYRDPDFREKWLTDQVIAGRLEGMLTHEEEREILEAVRDPYIRKYLKSLAVHLCTLPVTQVVSLLAALYALLFFGETWRESLAWAAGIMAFFQVTPISPGSLVRGSYVVYLMARERDVKNYWVACLVSFWHYVGYLGFPLQMVHHYPTLSRFMAGRWATQVVHVVPVFGEKGALLEHLVFDTFFNLPLTLRRLWLSLSRKRRAALGWSVGALCFIGMVGLVWAVQAMRAGSVP